jgi:biotin transport system substrate-specific component
MAAFTGLMAQFRVPLPWTPVPLTGQVFAVLLAGVLLGRRLGPLSQALYVGLGAAGLPWFADATGGFAALAGPTGGYLLGFVLTSLVLGELTSRRPGLTRLLPLTALMLVATALLIHLPGLLWLGVWTRVGTGVSPSFTQLLVLGFLPFALPDALKAILAALAARGLALRRRAD